MRDSLPTARLLGVARGEVEPDVVIEGARVFGAFTREWLEGDVAIADGRFAGVGSYEGGERIDGRGRWLCAGFIDAHMHVESSKLMVGELARLLVARGTTDDRLRSARARERARPRGRSLVPRRLRGPADGRARAGARVRAGEPVRVASRGRSRSPTWRRSSRTSACSGSPR